MTALAGAGEGEPLMTDSQASWSRALQASMAELGVPPDNVMHLYRLRHGGASHDVAHRLRSLGSVQKRGSWKTMASVAGIRSPPGSTSR